ncbi:MAG: hypothetical protein ACI9GW_001028 [Halieaceae bacterium]|jgi:hypothetical protein
MAISMKYANLLRAKGPTVLSVVTGDDSIQSSLVWSDFEDDEISISMLVTAPKYKRILRSKKATILKVDPEDEDNYISIRCSLLRVETEGAIEYLDKLTQRHMGKEKWYGEVIPDNDEEKENEVVVYLKPEKIFFT